MSWKSAETEVRISVHKSVPGLDDFYARNEKQWVTTLAQWKLRFLNVIHKLLNLVLASESA